MGRVGRGQTAQRSRAGPTAQRVRGEVEDRPHRLGHAEGVRPRRPLGRLGEIPPSPSPPGKRNIRNKRHHDQRTKPRTGPMLRMLRMLRICRGTAGTWRRANRSASRWWRSTTPCPCRSGTAACGGTADRPPRWRRAWIPIRDGAQAVAAPPARCARGAASRTGAPVGDRFDAGDGGRGDGDRPPSPGRVAVHRPEWGRGVTRRPRRSAVPPPASPRPPGA